MNMKRRTILATPLREVLDEAFSMPVDEVRLTLIRKADKTFECEIQVGNALVESEANDATEAVALAIDRLAIERA